MLNLLNQAQIFIRKWRGQGFGPSQGGIRSNISASMDLSLPLG